MFKLENELIKLRAVEPADADLLYMWENDTELWETGDTTSPYSRFNINDYIMSEGDIYANKQLRFMIDYKINNTLVTIGAVDLYDYNPFHSRAGVGILIYPNEMRNKGYAISALKLVINYALTVLDIKVLFCNVKASNTAGLNCMKKVGFEVCALKHKWNKGKNGREDEYTLQIVK